MFVHIHWSCLRDGRWSETAQIENTVRHMKSGHIKWMVVEDAGHSTEVLLYSVS